MSTSFEKYSDILLDAFQNNSRHDELAQKKYEIIMDLINHYDLSVNKILFIGFSPGILKCKYADIAITQVSDSVTNYLKQMGCSVRAVDHNDLGKEKFTVVIAVDEFLTFASTDQDQRDLVGFVSSVTDSLFVTTLRDYKNQDFKDREFSQPIVVRRGNEKKIYFEHYEYSVSDRNSYEGTNYIIDGEGVAVAGPFPRRSMYFKQLAKFSFDEGATAFLVHQNLMHKSVIKKNYEHIITIKF